jgi:hypothetical protein
MGYNQSFPICSPTVVMDNAPYDSMTQQTWTQANEQDKVDCVAERCSTDT